VVEEKIVTRASATRERWEPLVYGKLVTSTDGPIVAGFEHGCIGRSASFPQELVPLCHPSRIGLGERDPRLWAQCAWSREGGIVTGVGIAAREPWVIAARVRERSEAGEGVDGRLYTAALYAALPARVFTHDAIARIAPHLRAQPRESYDMELPRIDVSERTAVTPLPADWLERIAQILRGVMSGHSVNIQDWELKPEAFVDTATVCLAAVPNALRWRLAVGAGMMTMDSATAMAYGMSARGGLRVIGGVGRNESELDLARGSRYVDWLARVGSSCATVEDVAEVLDRELPHLVETDAIDINEHWAKVAQLVADTVTEKTLFVQVLGDLRGSATTSALDQLTVYRSMFIEELARRALGPESAESMQQLAETVRRGWNEAWNDALERTQGPERDRLDALAMLLGQSDVDRPSLLAVVAGVKLEGGNRFAVVDRLAEAVSAATEGRSWIYLLRAAKPDGDWVSEWREASMSRLVWLGIHDAVESGRRESQLLALLGDHPLVRVALELLEGRAADREWSQKLIEAAQPGDAKAIDELVRQAARTSAVQAYRLAEIAHANALAIELSDPAGAKHLKSRDGQLLAATLAREVEQGADLGPLMLRDLLPQLGDGSASPRGKQLGDKIARLIGDPYTTALLGLPPIGAVADPQGVARKYALGGAELGDDVAERVIRTLPSFTGPAYDRAVELLRRWLDTSTSRASRSAGAPAARMVRALAGVGSAPETSSIPEKHRPTVSRALTALRVQPVVIARAAAEDTQLELATDLWPDGSAMPLSAEQLHVVLEATLRNDQRDSRWRAIVAKRSWTNAAGWRWVAMAAREANEIEQRALSRLDGDTLLGFVLKGLPVPGELAGKIGRTELDRALRGSAGAASHDERVERLRKVLQFAERAKAEALLVEIARQAMQLARDEGKNKRSLSTALSTEGTGLGRALVARFLEPKTSVELLRTAARLLKQSPEDLIGKHWEGTRSRKSEARGRRSE
jgi:hypothetical protein